MAPRYLAATLAASLAFCAWPALASAHGLAGKRFFPSTLTIDDPFVADELSLPTFLHIKEPGEGDVAPSQITNISGEFSKRIFPNLGLTLEGAQNPSTSSSPPSSLAKAWATCPRRSGG